MQRQTTDDNNLKFFIIVGLFILLTDLFVFIYADKKPGPHYHITSPGIVFTCDAPRCWLPDDPRNSAKQ